MYHGKITRASKKRKAHCGGIFTETQIGDKKIKKVNSKGGASKEKLVTSKSINVVLEGNPVVCEIIGLEENPANRDYTRRKIITKGALLSVKTPDGKDIKVKVTSRPGQDGVLNAMIA